MALYKWICLFDRNVNITPEIQKQQSIKPGNFQPLAFTVSADTQEEAIQLATQQLNHQIYGKDIGTSAYTNPPPKVNSNNRLYKLISVRRL